MPNQLVDYYRSQFPQDDKSDDEITLQYVADHGDAASQYPGVKEDVDRIVKQSELARLGWGDYVKQFIGSGIRGAVGVVGSAPELAGLAADYIAPETSAAIAGNFGYPSLAEGMRGATRNVGAAVSPAAVDPLYDSFLSTTAPQALGSAVGFGAGGAALGKIAKLSSFAATAGLGAIAGGAEQAADAASHGADTSHQFLASLLGGVVGLSEAFPLARMLEKIDRASGGVLSPTLAGKVAGKLTAAFTGKATAQAVGSAVGEISLSAFEEGLQEAFQGASGNLIASSILKYDPDRQLLNGLQTDAGAGALTGAVLTLLTEAISHHLARGARPATAQQRVDVAEDIATSPDLGASVPPPGADVAGQYADKVEKGSPQWRDLRDLANESLKAKMTGGLDPSLATVEALKSSSPGLYNAYLQIRGESEMGINDLLKTMPFASAILALDSYDGTTIDVASTVSSTVTSPTVGAVVPPVVEPPPVVEAVTPPLAPVVTPPAVEVIPPPLTTAADLSSVKGQLNAIRTGNTEEVLRLIARKNVESGKEGKAISEIKKDPDTYALYQLLKEEEQAAKDKRNAPPVVEAATVVAAPVTAPPVVAETTTTELAPEQVVEPKSPAVKEAAHLPYHLVEKVVNRIKDPNLITSDDPAKMVEADQRIIESMIVAGVFDASDDQTSLANQDQETIRETVALIKQAYVEANGVRSEVARAFAKLQAGTALARSQGKNRRVTEGRTQSQTLGKPTAQGFQNSGVISNAYRNTIRRIRAAGFNVDLIQARLDQLGDEFFRRPGSGDITGNHITLVLSDLTAPNQDDYVAALHEVAHFLSSGLSAEDQARFHRAIDNLQTTTLPGIIEAGLTSEQLPEERGVERTARALAAEGFNPQQAQSLAQAFWRFLKDLTLRLGRFLQEGLFGEGLISDRLTEAWFQNRVRAFLAGDSWAVSLTTMAGGPNLNAEGRLRTFQPQNGGGWSEIMYDWRSGGWQTPTVVSDSASASIFNISNGGQRRTPESLAATDIDLPDVEFAAYNHESETLSKMWAATPNQKPFNHFVSDIAGLKESPDQSVLKLSDWLNSSQRPPGNPTMTFANFSNKALRDQAVAKSLRRHQDIDATMRPGIQENKAVVKRADDSLIRRTARLLRLGNNFHNAQRAAADVVDDVKRLIGELKTNLRAGLKIGSEQGVLTKTLQELGVKLQGEPGKPWERLIDKLAAEIGPGKRFTALLDEVAQLGIDWKNTSTTVAWQVIEQAAQSNPQLDDLVDGTDEAKARFAIVAAFGKQNQVVMDALALSRADKAIELAAVHQMIDALKIGTVDKVNEARKLAGKAGSLSVKAGRLMETWMRERAEFKARQAQRDAADLYVKQAEAAYPILRGRIQELEKELGAGEPFDLHAGVALFNPPNVSVTEDELKDHTVEYSRSPTFTGIGGIIEKCEAWLAAHPTGGAVRQRLVDQIAKLKITQVSEPHQGMRNGFLASIFGSASDLLNETGVPDAKAAGRRTKDYETNHLAITRQLEEPAAKVDNRRADAMNALGVSTEPFKALYHQTGLKFLEDNKGMLEQTNGWELLLAKLRTYLESDRHTMQQFSRPGAWKALEAYFRAVADANASREQSRRSSGVKIKDSLLGGTFREAIGDSRTTYSRVGAPMLERLYQEMRPLWETSPFTAAQVADEFTNDPAQFAIDINNHFQGDVISSFVEPLANDSNRARFSGVQMGGTWIPAKPAQIQQAWSQRTGTTAAEEIISFSNNLRQITGSSASEAEFLGETMDTLQNFFLDLHKQFVEMGKIKNDPMRMEVIPHQLMDGRVSESWPSQWLRYMDYGSREARQVAMQLAYQKAFGRDGIGLNADLNSAKKTLKADMDARTKIRERVIRENPGASPKQLDVAFKAAILKAGASDPEGADNYARRLEYAARQLQRVDTVQTQMSAWFHMNADSAVELRPWNQVLSMISGLMVQGVKTALTNTISLHDILLRAPLSSSSIRQVLGNWKWFSKTAAGSLLGTFNEQVHQNSEMALRMQRAGLLEPEGRLSWKERWRRDTSYNQLPAETGYSKPADVAARLRQAALGAVSFVRVGMGTSIGTVEHSKRLIPTVRPAAPFGTFNSYIDWGLVSSNWRAFDSLVLRAVEFYKANPQAAADLNHEITAADLGLKDWFILNNASGFDYQKWQMSENGMTLEGVARAAIANEIATGQMVTFTPKQDAALASMVLREVSLVSGPLQNRPNWWLNNPIMSSFTPLLGWAFSRTNEIRKAIRTPTGEVGWNTAKAGLKMLAAMLPIGLAYSWWRDEWDEKIEGKKSNIRGDNALLADIEKIARVGTLGLWGDLLNSANDIAAGGGDLRGVSVDERVVFLNSAMGFLHASSNWLHQGEASYETVWRPMLQSLGGSGYLQTMRAISHLFDIDTAEGRVASRINIGNWLVSGGRAMGLDVKAATKGSDAPPSPAKPHIRNMVLAAYANDSAGFEDSRLRAIAAYRSMNQTLDEARDSVKKAFSARNPIKVAFNPVPSESEMRKLILSLPDAGREDVGNGLKLFNRYAERLGARAYEGKVSRDTGSRAPTDYRDSAMRSLLAF